MPHSGSVTLVNCRGAEIAVARRSDGSPGLPVNDLFGPMWMLRQCCAARIAAAGLTCAPSADSEADVAYLFPAADRWVAVTPGCGYELVRLNMEPAAG